MAQQFWLGLDDGPSGTSLLDRGRITVLNRGFSAPPLADGMRVRAVTLQLRLSGSQDYTWQTVRDELNALLTEIEAEGRRRHRTSGVLSIALDGETWTYIDVVRGVLDITEILPRSKDAFATLTLTCLPLFRGAPLQAQNLLTSPCNLEDAAWTATNVTAEEGVGVAPDGSETATLLQETTATGNHEVRQEVAKAAVSGTYTLSCYVQSDGRDAVALYLSDGSGSNGAYAGYDLTDGTLLYDAGTSGSGFSAASAAITDAGDGWYRCILTATSNADTALRAYIQLHDGSGTSYAGDDDLGVIVWGAQLEEADSAGLLLVPLMLPPTVRAAYTIPGYEYDETDYSADPDNLWSGAWNVDNLTAATGQSDPSGGTGATRYTDNSTMSQKRWIRNATAVSMSGLPKTYTFGVYLKNYAGRDAYIALLTNSSTSPDGFGVWTRVNLSTGVMAANSAGTGYSLIDRTSTDLGNGWWFVTLTASVPSGAGSSLYGYVAPNGWSGYVGEPAKGIIVFRPQIVEGATIDNPLTTVVVDTEEVPAETISEGNLAGFYLYGVPGDGPAIYRVELDDDTSATDVAVNRLHIGAWSGRDVQMEALAPLSLLSGVENSTQSSGETQVGEQVPGIATQPQWQAVATLSVDDIVGPRGWFSAVARVRDMSTFLSQPGSVSVMATDGIIAKQVKRVSAKLAPPTASLSFGIPRTSEGSTLVIMTSWINLMTAGSASISANGGVSWSSLHTIPDTGRGRAAMWYAPNAAAISSTLTVSWTTAVDEPTITLIEIQGAAASPLDGTDVDYLSSRDADTMSGFASITTAQDATLLLSAGLGLHDWSQAFTLPVGDAAWYGVSSLSNGAIYAKTVAAAGAQSVRWTRFDINRGVTPPPEGWLVTLAAFKAAASTGADVTPGQWAIVVTAIADDGTESLPTWQVSVSVQSAASSVNVHWTPPAVGTPDGYRVYRNHGTGWAYAEVSANTLEYTFLDELSLTSSDPPSTSPPVIAWRLSVSLPSGQTLWRALTSVQSRLANGSWEDVALGDVPLPPIPAGEDETPDGALLAVEVAHIRGAQGDVNGIWLMDRASGQIIAYRDGMDATAPLDWVIDTNRDEISSAWLRDAAGAESGQAVIEPGVLTIWPGNAVVSIRPEVAGSESNLAQSDLGVRRVVVTPRYTWLRGRR